MLARLKNWVGVVLLLQAFAAAAVIETYEFRDEQTRERFQVLTQELRCPKCQNQNLADSDSQIAADLRAVLHEQLQAGKNDAEIVEFMRQRYGDFVLYKPLVQKNTLVLWFGPLLLIGIVAVLLWWSRQGQLRVAAQQVAELERRELDQNDEGVSTAQPVVATDRRKERLLALLLMGLVLLAMLVSVHLYRQHGALDVMQLTELSQRAFAPDGDPQQQLSDRAKLLASLNDWLLAHTEKHSSYASFLYMRARLWLDRADLARAADDYRKLLALTPEQENVQVEFAQILFQLNGEKVTPEVENALEQALRLNDSNVIALGMLGLHAYQTEQYQRAVSYWQRLMPMMPPNVPARAELEQAIARAQAKAGAAPAGDHSASAPVVKMAVAVELRDAAAALADDTVVFVLLRAHNGPRMPLAVVRTDVAALKRPVLLDSTDSPMMAQMDWSSVEQFEVVVRASRTGSVQPQAGDFEAVSSAFAKQDVPPQLSLTLAQPLP